MNLEGKEIEKFKIDLKSESIEMIRKELASIPDKYQKPFNSAHEGYAVLLEEVREIEHVVFFGEKEAKQEAVKNADKIDYKIIHKTRLREEAVQIAAMAIRIIQELS